MQHLTEDCMSQLDKNKDGTITKSNYDANIHFLHILVRTPLCAYKMTCSEF